MRVVGAADALGLVVEEALDSAGGLPVELDVGGLARIFWVLGFFFF